jgi:hypothetical protein
MTALATVPPPFWHEVESVVATHSCYSKQLKTDLVPGTFVLVVASAHISSNSRQGRDIVARIVRTVGGGPHLSVEVHIFRRMLEVFARRQLPCQEIRNPPHFDALLDMTIGNAAVNQV